MPVTAPTSTTATAAGRNQRRLLLVFGFTSIYLVAEVVGGILTGSLALLRGGAQESLNMKERTSRCSPT